MTSATSSGSVDPSFQYTIRSWQDTKSVLSQADAKAKNLAQYILSLETKPSWWEENKTEFQTLHARVVLESPEMQMVRTLDLSSFQGVLETLQGLRNYPQALEILFNRILDHKAEFSWYGTESAYVLLRKALDTDPSCDFSIIAKFLQDISDGDAVTLARECCTADSNPDGWKKVLKELISKRDLQLDDSFFSLFAHRQIQVTEDELLSWLPFDNAHTIENLQLAQKGRDHLSSDKVRAKIEQMGEWIAKGGIPILQDCEQVNLLAARYGKEFDFNFLNNLPLESKGLQDLLLSLCRFNHVAAKSLLARLISTLKTPKQPEWCDTTYVQRLYLSLRNAAGEHCVVPEEVKAFYIEPGENDEENCILAAALLQHMGPLSELEEMALITGALKSHSRWVQQLVDCNISFTNEQLEATFCKYPEVAEVVIQKRNLNSQETIALLKGLVKTPSSFTKAVIAHYAAAVKANKRPPRFTTALATDLFFELMEGKAKETAKLLIPCLDATKVNARGQTPLMVALEGDLEKESISELLSKSSLFHFDNEGKSALQLLLTKKKLDLPNQQLQNCLSACGISQAYTSYEDLIQSNANAPLPTRVLLYLLYNKEKEISGLLQESNVATRLDIIHTVGVVLGKAQQDRVINAAFSIDESHFSKEVALEKIPQKDPTMNIDQALTELYDSYYPESKKSAEKRAGLLAFANTVLNRTARGIPVTDDLSYTTMDAATCNTVKCLIEKARAAVEQKEKEEVSALISSFVDEYVAASGACGGRYMSTARQQFSLIVLKKAADLPSALLEATALMRESLANNLTEYEVERASGKLRQKNARDNDYVHAYNLFLQRSGRKFNIPGYSQMEQFYDSWAQYHNEQSEFAEAQFMHYYRPATITRFIQEGVLHDEAAHDQFKTELQERALTKPIPKAWYTIQIPRILTQLRKELQVTDTQPLTEEQQGRIKSFFASYHITLTGAKDIEELRQQKMPLPPTFIHLVSLRCGVTNPSQTLTEGQKAQVLQLAKTYEATLTSFTTLDDLKKMRLPRFSERVIAQQHNDLETLKTLEETLRGNNQLYLAYNREGGETAKTETFSPESIIEMLISMNILSRSVPVEAESRAINDVAYRAKLLKKLKVANGNINALTRTEKQQLTAAAWYVDELDLSGCDLAEAEMNQRVKDLVEFFPNLTDLRLSSTNVSSLPTLPVALEKLYINNCQKLVALSGDPFSNNPRLRFIDCSDNIHLETVTAPLPPLLGEITFSSCTDLKTLGEHIFDRCQQLQKVSFFESGIQEFNSLLPASLKEISFRWCTKLRTLGEHIFDRCRQLQTVSLFASGIQEFVSILPASLTRISFEYSALTNIREGVFSNCKSLRKEQIGLDNCPILNNENKSVFEKCAAIFNATLRQELVDKLQSAKGDIRALTEMEYTQLQLAGKCVTKFDLSGCDLDSASIDELIKTHLKLFPNLTELNLSGTKITQLPPLPATLETVELIACNGLETIGEEVFAPCKALKSLVLSSNKLKQFTAQLASSLETLNLTDCEELISLPTALPATVTSVDFSGCKKLEVLGDELLSLCTKLSEITFAQCTRLRQLPAALPESLEKITLTGTALASDANGLAAVRKKLPLAEVVV